MLPCAVAGENEKVWAGARAGEYDENTVFPADSKHVPRHARGSSFRAHTRRAPRSGRGDGAGRGRHERLGSAGREREADGSPGARARDAVDPDDARYDSNAEVEYGDPDDRDDDLDEPEFDEDGYPKEDAIRDDDSERDDDRGGGGVLNGK